ncbi:MAG: domain containing protein [Verrucomicrobiales bacterium]|nr:domain containing protein [Verrucomicrobiales bacterium]
MKRRSILLLVGCILSLGTLAGLVFSGQREPEYEGRPLSSWLGDVDTSRVIVNQIIFVPTAAPINRESSATHAIRNMGTQAYPFLLQMLKEKDSAFKKSILKKLGWQRSMKLGLLTAEEKQYRARMAMYRLGTNAGLAWKQILLDPTFDRELRLGATSWCQTLPEEAPQMIPVMVRLMSELQPDQQEFVTSAMGRFGPDIAVPLLVRQLQDENYKIQLMSMRAIKFLGSAARPAVPAVAQQLKSANEEVGLAAANTLLSLDAHHLQALVYRMHHGELGKRVGAYWMTAREEREPEFVIPELMRGLTDAEPEIRQAAAEGLTKFGMAAQKALPALTNLLGDSKRYVRVAATNAIGSIVLRRGE